MKTKAIRLALCAAAMGAATANAEDYTVPARTSKTMTLSGGATTTYDAVTVAGDLTVTSGRTSSATLTAVAMRSVSLLRSIQPRQSLWKTGMSNCTTAGILLQTRFLCSFSARREGRL